MQCLKHSADCNIMSCHCLLLFQMSTDKASPGPNVQAFLHHFTTLKDVHEHPLVTNEQLWHLEPSLWRFVSTHVHTLKEAHAAALKSSAGPGNDGDLAERLSVLAGAPRTPEAQTHLLVSRLRREVSSFALQAGIALVTRALPPNRHHCSITPSEGFGLSTGARACCFCVVTSL